MPSLSGLPEVPCAKCGKRVPGLAWTELCPECRWEREARARRLSSWMALAATALMGLYVTLRLPAHSSMRFQAEVEQGRRTVVGVNDFVEEAEAPVEILKVGNEAEQTQRRRMARVRAERDAGLVEQRLAALRSAAAEDRNIIPAMLDCARAYCTLYEIRHVLEEIYGNYREPVFF